MELNFEISKRLSREHLEVTSLLGRLEKFMQSGGRDHQPDWQGPEVRRVMSDLRGALRAEIPNHFAIEEQVLFPLFAQENGTDLVELLLDDHKAILGFVADLKPLVEKALGSPDGLSQSEWEAFRAKGQALVTELTAHAEKEEFGFVPPLDEGLDPATAKDCLNRYLLM